MNELQQILIDLCARVPDAIGAVCCDYEGETVVSSLGKANASQEAQARAMEHVPRRMKLTMPLGEFLVRLAGAEPCALMRMFAEIGARVGAGSLQGLSARYADVEMLTHSLPNEYYIVLLVRRPAVQAMARRHLSVAAEKLAVYIE